MESPPGTVFKTVALNRSATLPSFALYLNARRQKNTIDPRERAFREARNPFLTPVVAAFRREDIDATF